MASWLKFLLPEVTTRTSRLPKGLGADPELAALLARMRQCLYQETLPVLVSYWLKAVCGRGYELRWWRKLHRELTQLLVEQPPADSSSRQILSELHTWIQNEVLLAGSQRPCSTPQLVSLRTSLDPAQLKSYIVRLLNEWLPVEVARLLVNEDKSAMWQGGGIPALAIATSLERLLVREHLSPETIEMLLSPELLSPRYVYPADAEILRNVVLGLLGRTSAPAPPSDAGHLAVCRGRVSSPRGLSRSGSYRFPDHGTVR